MLFQIQIGVGSSKARAPRGAAKVGTSSTFVLPMAPGERSWPGAGCVLCCRKHDYPVLAAPRKISETVGTPACTELRQQITPRARDPRGLAGRKGSPPRPDAKGWPICIHLLHWENELEDSMEISKLRRGSLC
jgi:hypothetical protein